jgi:hypothetical protein
MFSASCNGPVYSNGSLNSVFVQWHRVKRSMMKNKGLIVKKEKGHRTYGLLYIVAEY